MTYRVCLIVDNPLRDLDGLTLLAWQLAQRGVEAWLVPMYAQAFDVRAIGASFVLTNYVRKNNAEHLLSYLREDIKLGVLDTEGVGGKNADEFATLVASSGRACMVDLYCLWGGGQFEALRTRAVVPEDRMRVTGCPRYDFCAPQWQAALPSPAVAAGYVLVNTNFPIVNPRFSAGAHNERLAMVNAGFTADFADRYVRDARRAHEGVLEMLSVLPCRFPDRHFVLRPHPFESTSPYLPLCEAPNFEIRQEGTSIEWLNACAALVHLNCSTAIEAALLGRPALSPAWLDTPTLNVPGPHGVSQHAESLEVLVQRIEQALAAPAVAAAPAGTLRAAYHEIDGHAAERVAQCIVDTLQQPPIHRPALPSLSPRASLALRARRLLGYRSAAGLQAVFESEPARRRKQAKLFTVSQVQAIVGRLHACSPGSRSVLVDPMADGSVCAPRLASGSSVRLRPGP